MLAGSFELLAYFLPFAVIGVGIARLEWSRRAISWLGVELVGLALVFAGIGVAQYATRNLFWNPKVIVANAYLPFYRVNSVFWDPSIYGRFLMIAILAALVIVMRGPSRRLAVTAAIAIAGIWVGLVLSYSQSSFAGLIAAVVLLMAVVWRRAALLAAAFVAVVLVSTGIANPNIQNAFLKRSSVALNRATSDRAGLIYNGLRIAVRNPVVGVGVGAFRHHYAELTHLKGKEPKKAASHDTPVTVAAENGLIGLGLFLWVLVAAFRTLARTRGDPFMWRVVLAVSLALTAITVHSLFYDHFFEDPTTWALLGLAGLAYGAARQGRQRLSLRQPRNPRRRRSANAQRDAPAGLGRLGPGEPHEHLEAGTSGGIGAPRRLVEPDPDEHVVAVELTAHDDPARNPCAGGRAVEIDLLGPHEQADRARLRCGDPELDRDLAEHGMHDAVLEPAEEHVPVADEARDLAVHRAHVEHRRLVALHDRPALEHRDTVGDRERLVLVVGDEDDGGAGCAEHVDDLAPHARAELDVERGEGLVEQDERRMGGERAGERDPLALPAREMVRQPLLEAGEPDELEQLRDPRLVRRPAAADLPGAERRSRRYRPRSGAGRAHPSCGT